MLKFEQQNLTGYKHALNIFNLKMKLLQQKALAICVPAVTHAQLLCLLFIFLHLNFPQSF
jgi:hypothetical protein